MRAAKAARRARRGGGSRLALAAGLLAVLVPAGFLAWREYPAVMRYVKIARM